MDFTDYDLAASSTAFYPEAGEGTLTALNYTVLGLLGEAGEIANKLKKVYRDNDGVLTPEVRAELAKECGDVLWYFSRAVNELGYSSEEIAAQNANKLASRKLRGVLQGSGDNR